MCPHASAFDWNASQLWRPEWPKLELQGVCSWVQAFLVKLFEDVNLCAIHAKRATILVHALTSQPQ
jgi:hypothetical protein